MDKVVPKFYGKVGGGKLSLYEQDRFKKYLSGLQGEIELVVQKKRKVRSLAQCRYYFGVIIPLICAEWGEDKNTVHDYLKKRFLSYRKEIKTPKGNRTVELIGSTAKLNTAEFVDFNEKVKMWASQNLNCYIPDPGEVY